MGPHPLRDITEEAARERLPGWDIWHVSILTPRGRTWSARPTGATVAVPGCMGLPDLRSLVEKALEYQAHLGEHIAATRTELDDTPPAWAGRRGMLESRLSALLILQASTGGEG